MRNRFIVAFAAAALLAAAARAQEPHGSKIVGTPQWEQLKTLVGEWNGYVMEGEKKHTSLVSFRMTGDGSALMQVMDAGTPHEMITMFHMDKDDLLATHYCAGHNQPRMRAVPSAVPGRVAFEFKDGTNIRSGDGFMRQITVVFLDADHHDEEWGYDQNGKVSAGTFHFERVTPAGKS